MKRKEGPQTGPPQLSKKQAKRDAKRAAAAAAAPTSKPSSTSTAATKTNNQPSSSSAAAGSSVYKRLDVLPTPCPIPNLKSRFYTPADSQVYPHLLRTSYDGFVVDPPTAFEAQFHDEWAKVFADFDAGGIFQYDYTQPAGLNTKIAKTFVTRYVHRHL